MGEATYDGSIMMNRKLNEEETKELRRILTHEFDVPEGGEDVVSAEDVSDLLDYTLAMLSNGKSVDYAIQELINMEIDFCTSVTAHRVGEKLAGYLRSLPPAEPNDVKEDDDGAAEKKEAESSRIISLKVGWLKCTTRNCSCDPRHSRLEIDDTVASRERERTNHGRCIGCFS